MLFKARNGYSKIYIYDIFLSFNLVIYKEIELIDLEEEENDSEEPEEDEEMMEVKSDPDEEANFKKINED